MQSHDRSEGKQNNKKNNVIISCFMAFTPYFTSLRVSPTVSVEFKFLVELNSFSDASRVCEQANEILFLDCVHTMPAHFENDEKCDGSKILAFKRCRNNLNTVETLTVKNSFQDFDVKEMYLHPKNRSFSFQKRRKMFCLHHFRVFIQCRFQNVLARVPFSKPTVFEICRQKMCRFRVNVRPIRHISHRFQNVPASYERSLSHVQVPQKHGTIFIGK